MHPSYCTLSSLSLTVPISSCACDISFTAMSKVKNCLHTLLSKNRFSNSPLIYIKNLLYRIMNNLDILNAFFAIHSPFAVTDMKGYAYYCCDK